MKPELNEDIFMQFIVQLFEKRPELTKYSAFNRAFDGVALRQKRHFAAFKVSLDFFQSILPYWKEPEYFFFTILHHLQAYADRQEIPAGIALAAAVYLGCSVIGEDDKNFPGRIKEYKITPPVRK